MAYPLFAVAAYLWMRKSNATQGERAAYTTVAGFAPPPLSFVPAVLAARQGKGSAFGGIRRPLMRYQMDAPPPPPEPTPDAVQVPQGLVGGSLKAAQDKLKGAHLVPAWKEVWSSQPDGFVLKVHPLEGAVVALDSVVRLDVAKNGSPPSDDEPTAAAEMAEMKTIEGKVVDLKTDVDTRLGATDAKIDQILQAVSTLAEQQKQQQLAEKPGQPSPGGDAGKK